MNAPDLSTLVRLGAKGIYRLSGDGAATRRQMTGIQAEAIVPKTLKRVGIAADHGGFELKEFLAGKLRAAGYEVTDFGDYKLKSDDDYPDFIIPLARAIAAGTVDRGVGICGSGIGASIAANKVAGVRAALIDENFSAHQGVEDDDLNMICFGGQLVGHAPAWELVQIFLTARFKGAERFRRRLAKVAQLEGTSKLIPAPVRSNSNS